MIISKEKKKLLAMNNYYGYQKFLQIKDVKNLEIFKSNNNKFKNKTDLAKNDLTNQDDNTQIKKFSAECSTGHIRIENKCIKKEFLDEFENQLNSNIEILKNELANLKKRNKKKFKLKTDTKIPFIGSLNYSYDEHIVTINGLITDNFEVAEAFIDTN